MGNIVCTGTSRIALVLTLQKKNPLGQWVDVKTTSGFGNTTAYVENSKSCTNTKITTWRSVILVVGNGGAWTFQKTSPSTYTAYCGT